MQFLWKSQLKKERGKFLPKSAAPSKKTTRKERLSSALQKGSHPYVGIGILWALFLGTGVYLVLFSPYLAFKEPQITGLEMVDERVFGETLSQELGKHYFDVISRNRYFLLRPEALEQALSARYPLLKAVVVTRSFPDELTITVTERETLLLWCSSDTCLHLLESGHTLPLTEVYQESENQARTLILRDMSGQSESFGWPVWEEELVMLPVLLRQSLRDIFSLEIEQEMSFSSRLADELRVKTVEGWEIFFGTHIPLETSLGTLKLVFEKEIPEEKRAGLLYIDLRTENRVFYRYRENEKEENPIETSSSTKEKE